VEMRLDSDKGNRNLTIYMFKNLMVLVIIIYEFQIRIFYLFLVMQRLCSLKYLRSSFELICLILSIH
jgi:hypothetical protein